MTKSPEKTLLPGSLASPSGVLSHHAYLVVPVLLLIAIGWFAPNFRIGTDRNEVREHPVGGDYLQEYVGGHLVRHQVNQTYDLPSSRKLQHDNQWLGFQWEAKSYFPMVYPPFYYLAVSPLSELEYSTAARIWLVMMTVALIASLLLLHKQLGLSPLALIVVSLTVPILLSLNCGQKSTVLLLIFTATFCLLRREKHFSAGAVFALIAFKPHLAIPLGLMMAYKKQWRFLGGAFVVLALQVSMCSLAGIGVCLDYVNVCVGMGDYVQTGGYVLEKGFSFWSAWQLLLGGANVAKLASFLSASAIVVAMLRSWRGQLSLSSRRFEIQFSLVIFATVLVAPHLYSYDLTMLILPAALVSRSAANANVRAGWLALFAIMFFFTEQIIELVRVTTLPIGVAMLVFLFAALVTFAGDQKTLRPARKKQLSAPC